MSWQYESIYIWNLRWDEYLTEKDYLWQLLSNEEQYRSKQFLSLKMQSRFVVTRGLLRILIGKLINKKPHLIQFKTSLLGKLSIFDIDTFLEFNITHSKNNVIYAFSFQYQLGIDVEHSRNINAIDAIASRFFSTREIKILNHSVGCQKQTVFLTGWMQKEAVAKSLGFGLMLPLSTIEVNLADNQPKVLAVNDSRFHHVNWLLYRVTVHTMLEAILAIITQKKYVKILQSNTVEM